MKYFIAILLMAIVMYSLIYIGVILFIEGVDTGLMSLKILFSIIVVGALGIVGTVIEE